MSAEFLDAVKAGNLARVRALLDKDPGLRDARTPAGTHAAIFALYVGHPDVSMAILERRPELDLATAAGVGDFERVKELVGKNPKSVHTPTADGFTPLGLAAYLGQRPIVGYLLRQGADVNHVGPEPNRFTALTGAISAGHADVVEVLVANGADVNHRYEEGNTPLTEAAFGGDARIVRTLLEHGADPNVRNKAGKTALSLAMEKGNREAADVLLKHGAKA
jgi:uncharacterized protein